MLVPLSWLSDFAPFDVDLDPRDLARVFDELGMVVEGMETIGGGLDGVVTARIVAIEPIPGLDKVRLTRVDPGDGTELEVACGAWNIDVGNVVPLATVGTTLPSGMTIGARKLRSVTSHGMLCSAVELGLGDDAAGILLLDPSTPLGLPAADALGVRPDFVYDLAIEGNRPDANCVAGVARDAAARLGLAFRLPQPSFAESGPAVGELAQVRVDCPDLCPRFTARVLRDVTIGSSPIWVQRRLTLAGMRAINNVVDASNYVMLELGQPTHPYDLDRLPGRGLVVRRAKPGEIVRTLDGVDRRTGDGDDCLICDAEGNPVGIGGVMGGASSEISDTTTSVLLEAATFAPMAIAWTSKRLGLRTEASARFERGTDPLVIDLAVARFCELAGSATVAPGMLDERQGLAPRDPIDVRPTRVNALLGASLSGEEMATYLRPIGFDVELSDGETVLRVTPPSFRPDATIEEDVIEEVARHHGYGRIARTVPKSPFVGLLSPHQADRRNLRQILAGAGVTEAQCPSLLGPGDHEKSGLLTAAPIAAANAMIQEESLLRTSLMPGLLRAVAYNVARRNLEVAFFEVGNVWPGGDDPGADLPVERERVAVVLAGEDGDAVAATRLLHTVVRGLRLDADAVEVAAATDVEGLHPARTARVLVGGAVVGAVGEVEPDVVEAWGIEGRAGWLDLDLVDLFAAPRQPLAQQPVSRFPSADVDLAFVVPEAVPASQVEQALRRGAGELLSAIDLFDVYRGDRVPPATRSLAYRLRFCALDRTLTDREVADVRAGAIVAAESAGAALRGA